MRIKLEDLPVDAQNQIRAKLASGQVVGPCTLPAKVRTSKSPTDTEAAYRREILDTNPAVTRVGYEAMTFRMSNGHRYTPDWVFVCGGRIHCVEVKGSYRLGSYQRACLAFDQAATEWPEFVWLWAERGPYGWKTSQNATKPKENNNV